TSKLSGSFMLLTTADILPSFHKSPTTNPRDDRAAVIPGPEFAEISSNFPFPKLWYSTRGSSYSLPRCCFVTSGYTCPFTSSKSGQPSLSTSTNIVPHPRYFVYNPSPASNVTLSNVPSPLFRYRVEVSSEKFVLKMSSLPSPL